MDKLLDRENHFVLSDAPTEDNRTYFTRLTSLFAYGISTDRTWGEFQQHDDDDFDDVQAAASARWFGDVCKCIQWRRTFQYRSKGEPINRGELRAVRTAVRQIIGVYSSVVEGVLAKGRSSSRELNLLLRSMAADMLVGDIQLGI